jgi:hypothetical protein
MAVMVIYRHAARAIYRTRLQESIRETMSSKTKSSLLKRIARLSAWIKEEGERTNTCTFGVLGDVCDGCRCERQWRRLEESEIVQEGDEVLDELGEWVSVCGYLGLPAPDPKYTAHCQFRRSGK